MISVQEALERIIATMPELAVQSVSLANAGGLFLAESVHAHHPLPHFDNSAMDGYAVVASDTTSASEASIVSLKITQSIHAGPVEDKAGPAPIISGTAARIFTGAPVPPGATAVVRQEDVIVDNGRIIVCKPIPTDANIRRRGEEISEGDVILEKGAPLNPAAIGLLATSGYERVQATPPPEVGVIVTGSEIVPPGSTLRPGQIYDSNSFTVKAALEHSGIPVQVSAHASDDRDALRAQLNDGLSRVNILIVTGGVSVGEYDLVKDSASDLGLETILWRVRQKPGKPLFAAASRDRSKVLFGLPGNPASVLVCYYEYVLPALRKAMGAADWKPVRIQVPLGHHFTKKGNLTHFLKGKLSPDGTVEILDKQGSHMLSSFARATCLVVIPEDRNEFAAGENVEVHLLP